MLLAGGLGGGAAVVGVGEEPGEEAGVDPPGRGAAAVLVEVPCAAAELAHGGVDQGVRRAGVEGQRGGVRIGGHHGDVGDAAEVERGPDARAGGVPVAVAVAGAVAVPVAVPVAGLVPAQQQGVEEADQRGALAARRHVPAAQVGDDREPGRLGDPGGLPELEGAAHPSVLHPVVDRLPVRDHQVGGARAELLDGADGRGGEDLAELGVQSADRLHGGRGRRQHGGDPATDPGVQRKGQRAQRAQQQLAVLQGEFGRGGLHRVVGGAGHQADHPHGHSPAPAPAAPDPAGPACVAGPA